MNIIAVLAILGLGSQCLAGKMTFDEEFGSIFNVGFEIIRQFVHENSPLPIYASFKNLAIETQDMNFTMDMSSIQISKFNDFHLENLKTDSVNLIARIKTTIPQVLLTFHCNVDGVIHDEKITGSGNVSISIRRFHNTLTFSMKNPITSVAISQLDLDYDVDLFEINENGLEIEGMTNKEIEEFISQRLFEIIISDKFKASAAENLQRLMNNTVFGELMSVKEISYYLMGSRDGATWPYMKCRK